MGCFRIRLWIWLHHALLNEYTVSFLSFLAFPFLLFHFRLSLPLGVWRALTSCISFRVVSFLSVPSRVHTPLSDLCSVCLWD